MRNVVAPPPTPIGKTKSLGPFGPKYEVGCAIHRLDDDDWMVEITLIETGEKTLYRLSRIEDDPQAR